VIIVIAQWLAEAFVPSLFAFFVMWRILGKSKGVKIGAGKYIIGVASTMCLAVGARFLLLFLFGGAVVVYPSGNWSIVLSLAIPLAAAAGTVLLVRRMGSEPPRVTS